LKLFYPDPKWLGILKSVNISSLSKMNVKEKVV